MLWFPEDEDYIYYSIVTPDPDIWFLLVTLKYYQLRKLNFTMHKIKSCMGALKPDFAFRTTIE